MNFLPEQKVHVEDDIAERADIAWKFRHSVSGQLYCVMCIVSPTGTRQKLGSSESAIKIFGCFPTLESANAEAAKISDACDFFDVYVCSTNDWVAIPPDHARIEDVTYHEDRLQKLHEAVVQMRTGRSKEMMDRIQKDKEAQKALKEAKASGEAETDEKDESVDPAEPVEQLLPEQPEQL